MWYVTVADCYPANTEEMECTVYGKGATKLEAMQDALRTYNTDHATPGEGQTAEDVAEPLELNENGFYSWAEMFDKQTVALLHIPEA